MFSMLRFYISFMCHFFTPVCYDRLIRAIHRPLFLVAWPAHNLLITLPASHQPFCFSFSTLSASSLVSHRYTHSLVWICLNISSFFLCFMWPIRQQGSAEPSNTILVAWPAHNSLIVIFSSPTRTLFGFAQTIPFHQFTYIWVCTCLCMFYSQCFTSFHPSAPPTGPAE